MIIKSPAKINLYLHIKGRYPSGFHEIDSLFVRINLCDDVEIVSTLGPDIEILGDLTYLKKENLCYKAASLLKQKSGCRLGCKLLLKKRVPIGAGLGGGSSNAAAVLIGLNKLWNLKYTKQELKIIGKQIGADVPFFIEEANCYARGIGEHLTVLENDNLLPKFFVTLTPDIKVSTSLIFKNFQLTTSCLMSSEITMAEKDILKRQKYFTFGRNDLETTAFRMFPEISEYMQEMKYIATILSVPVESCRMSGSGSTIFCGFPSEEIALKFNNALYKHLRTKQPKKMPLLLVSKLFNS